MTQEIIKFFGLQVVADPVSSSGLSYGVRSTLTKANAELVGIFSEFLNLARAQYLVQREDFKYGE